MDYSFGNWVKRKRKALDLTQQALARRVGCSLATIVKIESDERRPSRQIAELLAQHLEIPSDQRDVFLKVARQEKAVDSFETFPPAAQPPPALVSRQNQHSLPLTLPPLIGREHELRAILQQIQDPACRLLTLTGPGGVGKTRLALEAAHRLRDSIAHGVCFVPLAGTSAPEFIVPAIADTLGMGIASPPNLKSQLSLFLRDKEMLLVLDNLEHLLNGIELLGEMLERAPRLKLLTTSREGLNLRAEWTFEIQGLPVPADSGTADLESNSAASLFMQRARQARADFTVHPDEFPAIARICRLVEGLPLGLELAASWVRMLPIREIADEIERNMDFLSTNARDVPDRHRSFRAVFDYSWNLLLMEEQRVLMQLSTFQGGFTRQAAEEVAGASLSMLASLAGKSFIHRSDAGGYEQHELVRQYSALHLQEDAQNERATRDRHARYYLSLWHESEDQLKSAKQRNILRELTGQIDNFRAAWNWSLSQGQFDVLGSSLRAVLIVYDLRGWYEVGIERLQSLIEAFQSAPELPSQNMDALGLALSIQGWFHFRRGALQEARDRFEAGLAILRPLDDLKSLADALTLFSPLMTSLGDSEKAIQQISEGLSAARTSKDRWRIAQALMMQGGILAGWGKYEEAYTSSREALSHFRSLGDTRLIVVTLNTLGYVAIQLSRYDEARAFLQESLTVLSPAEDPWSVGTAYGNLGIVELAQGNASKARAFLQKSILLFTELGMMGDVASYLVHLGEVFEALGSSEEAEQNWLDAIRMARDVQALPTTLACLIRLAGLHAARGDRQAAYEWAAWLAQHPAAWQDTKNRAEVLLGDLTGLLSREQIERARSRVESLTLDTLVDQTLAAREAKR